jgi:hypothetical protein
MVIMLVLSGVSEQAGGSTGVNQGSTVIAHVNSSAKSMDYTNDESVHANATGTCWFPHGALNVPSYI